MQTCVGQNLHVDRHMGQRRHVWMCVSEFVRMCLSPEACVRTHEWSDSCGYRYARTQDWVCTRACVTSAHRQAVGL